MKKLLLFLVISTQAFALPSKYTDLLDYVMPAPDQGETTTCLFMASTGAMEMLANIKYDLKHQTYGDRFDLSEQFLMWQKSWPANVSWYEANFLKFNYGQAIHTSDLPFQAWTGDQQINWSVWNYPLGYEKLPRMQVPKVKTQKLFIKGGKWDTNVLTDEDVKTVKEALVKYKSPVLVGYNDEGYWHVLLIVGYDDDMQGECYDTNPKECEGDIGSFYIRDSFGIPVEIRDYDWFRVKGNAAFVMLLDE